jgi:hypothetical protein
VTAKEKKMSDETKVVDAPKSDARTFCESVLEMEAGGARNREHDGLIYLVGKNGKLWQLTELLEAYTLPLRQKLEQAEKEISTCEKLVCDLSRNREYWKQRCEAKESESAALREQLQKIADVAQNWSNNLAEEWLKSRTHYEVFRDYEKGEPNKQIDTEDCVKKYAAECLANVHLIQSQMAVAALEEK